MEVCAGERATRRIYGPDVWMPEETLHAVRDDVVSITDPLITLVGGGIRSLNVALSQELDLYACLRPIQYFKDELSRLKTVTAARLGRFFSWRGPGLATQP